jgi:LPXTG-site transpeptidase (sortase) family protein
MIFPRIDLGIDVAKAKVDLGASAWPLSDVSAHYADFSAKLGDESGTMLLYGHNTWPVLKKTHDLTIGDELILIDTQGQSWRFELTKLSSVTPDQVGFIYEDTDFRVVIFTCNGWNDEYRRLMYFEPIE